MHHLRVFGVCAIVLAVGACAKLPQADVDAARAAVEAAISNPDVLTYAPDSLRAAQEKLASLESELASQQKKSPVARGYDRLQALAREAVVAGQSALNDAQTSKQQAARDAASLIEKIGTTLPDFESRIWSARRVRGIDMKNISDLAFGVDQQRLVIDDARKDLDAGSFAAARAKAMAVQDWLSRGEERITEQTRIARAR
jgi:soluble cytochrome b562